MDTTCALQPCMRANPGPGPGPGPARTTHRVAAELDIIAFVGILAGVYVLN